MESPFAALGLRADAAKRFKKVEIATAVIFMMPLLTPGRFRRLNAAERIQKVYLGVRFQDGIEIEQERLQELTAAPAAGEAGETRRSSNVASTRNHESRRRSDDLPSPFNGAP